MSQIYLERILNLMPAEQNLEELHGGSPVQRKVADMFRVQLRDKEKLAMSPETHIQGDHTNEPATTDQQKGRPQRQGQIDSVKKQLADLFDSMQGSRLTPELRKRQRELLDGAVSKAGPLDYNQSSKRRRLSNGELLDKLREEAASSIELAQILRKAKPELSPKAQEIRTELTKDMKDRPSGEKFRQSIEDLLREVSPATIQDYEARGVKLVATDEDLVWTPNGKDEKGQWYVQVPIHFKNPLQLALRLTEVPLQIDHKQNAEKLPRERQHEAVPSLERRAEIHVRVCELNYKLDAWDIKEHKLDQDYRRYYEEGIKEAHRKGKKIDTTTPNDQLQEIGHAYAHKKVIESFTSQAGEEGVYLSFGPAARYEEIDMQRDQKPMKLGTEEFHDFLEKFLKDRELEGINTAFTTVTGLDEGIWVQPYHLSEKKTSNHGANARAAGDDAASRHAGTDKFSISYDGDGKRIIYVDYTDDESGHYRAIHRDKPWVVSESHVKNLKKLGYDTSKTVMRRTQLDGRNHPYNLEPDYWTKFNTSDPDVAVYQEEQ